MHWKEWGGASVTITPDQLDRLMKRQKIHGNAAAVLAAMKRKETDPKTKQLITWTMQRIEEYESLKGITNVRPIQSRRQRGRNPEQRCGNSPRKDCRWRRRVLAGNGSTREVAAGFVEEGTAYLHRPSLGWISAGRCGANGGIQEEAVHHWRMGDENCQEYGESCGRY
jgi:hypothetical protein